MFTRASDSSLLRFIVSGFVGGALATGVSGITHAWQTPAPPVNVVENKESPNDDNPKDKPQNGIQETPNTVAPEPETTPVAPATPRAAEPTPATPPAVLEAPTPLSSAPEAEAAPSRDTVQIERFLSIDNHRDVRTASFQDLTPGVTKLESVRRKLGEPLEKKGDETNGTWTYKIGPFPRVHIYVLKGVVQQAIVDLQEPTDIKGVEAELQLTRFESSPDFSPTGEQLGRCYPERGMRLRLVPNSQNSKTDRIILQPVCAADFLNRVRYDSGLNYRSRLADIEQVLSMEPGNEEAIWFHARIVEAAGFPHQALAQLQKAQQAGVDTPLLRLEAAHLKALSGKLDEAQKEIEQVLLQPDLSALSRARAQLQLGFILSHANVADYKNAVKRYTEAISTAVPVSKEGPFIVRRDARQIILEAHLGVAQAIARGGFRNKVETARKWLTNAESLADRMIASDYAPSTVKLVVWIGGLKACAALDGAIDPQPSVDPLSRVADKLLSDNKDDLFQRHLRAQYGEALLEAAQIYQRRGATERAEASARRALEVLSEAAHEQPPDVACEWTLGRTYYLLGAISAVAKRDHAAAVRWYDQAWPVLVRPASDELAIPFIEQGDQLVSMGVSYWQTGDQTRAMQATEQGVELIKQSRNEGPAAVSLALAYSNLAAMHESLGSNDKAQSFTELARQLEKNVVR